MRKNRARSSRWRKIYAMASSTRWLANFDEAALAPATVQTPLGRLTDLDDTARVHVMLARK